jgi:prepilin peptidase CpaA
MSWIALGVLALQVLLLVTVAANDVATRTIPNAVSLMLALLGLAGHVLNPAHLAQSLIAAPILFLLLLAAYARGWTGGGDVKLLAALAIGLPLTGLAQLLTVTALSGAGLALIHLAMRLLPDPQPAPAGASLLRRVYAVERWRNRRRAPLPYGAAIAFGGVWTLLGLGH